MIWFKRVSLGLLALVVLLLVLVAGLLFTHTGNQWLWQLAQRQLPGLSGELVSGQLAYGWQFSRLAYEDESLSVKAEAVTIDWELQQVLDKRFWLKRLDAADLEVSIKALPAGGDDQSGEPLGEIAPPLLVDLDEIRADRVKISLPGQTIAWQSLLVSARWDNTGMRITGPQMSGLTITLSESGSAGSEPAQADPGQPLALPEIRLPFPLQVEQLRLLDSRLVQNGRAQVLSRLEVNVQGQQSELTIGQFEMDHELASLALTGEATLSGDYPLAMQLDAELHEPLLDGQLAGQRLALTLSQSVARLKARLALREGIDADAVLSAALLQPELPFDLTLDYKQLGWPLNQPAWRLEQGKLTLEGNLDGYRLGLNSQAQGPDLPEFAVALTGRGDMSQLTLAPLRLTLPEGELALEGRLGWARGIDWDGVVNLNEVDPSVFVAELPGRLNGAISSRFSLAEGHWQLRAEPDVSGRLRDYPLRLQGRVTLDDSLQGEIEGVQLNNGDNVLTVNGRIDSQWQLEGELNAPDLAVYLPGLYGSLAGRIDVRGERDAPRVSLDIKSPKAGFNGSSATDLALVSELTLGKVVGGSLSLTAAQLQSDELRWQDLRLEADGDQQAHRLSLAIQGKPLAGELALTGGLDEAGWRGKLVQARLDTPLDRWQLEPAVDLSWIQAQSQLRASAHCWRSGEASLCMDALQASADRGKGGFNFNRFDIARLQAFFPDDFSWQAVLEGRAEFAWQGKRPQLNADIRATPGTFVSRGTRVAYQSLTFTANTEDNRLASELDFRSDSLGNLRVNANVSELNGRRGLSGDLAIDSFNLDWLAPLLPEVLRLQGTLAGQGRLDGTLSKPLLFGNINLTGGEVDTRSDIVTVRDFSSRLDIRGDNALITGTMRMGRGRLNIDGELDWASLPISGEIRLKGSELGAGYPGLGRVRVSPDLQITLGEQARIRGELLIPWARIEVKSLPESAVGLSSDVVIVQRDGVIQETGPRLPVDIRLQVRLLEDVRLEAYGLKTRLEGRLRLVQRPGQTMRANGEIRLNNGNFRAYGQNLLIREGSILFSGPLDQPNLSVEAIRNPSSMADSTVTAGVRVTGSAAQPEFTVFTEPPMPQVEQLSWLLRGRGLSGGGETDSNAMMQSMLIGAGVSQVGGVVTGVAESLGLQDVVIDTEGSGEGTGVSLSAYVLPGLQIGYGVGVFSAIGEVRLRYELLPRLYLQAASGLNQAIDLFYKFEF
ncbi:autotransporter assembly complex protein TamB [Zobellella maritima]|uniref:autotransporter assembly complex protein TamB n=1 Tax=Zobellella maritima TaxID=2059725 RepID=UPI001E5EE35A|nr:translocation/assembly module TamB domain-containing protein [Zobellella maritima]